MVEHARGRIGGVGPHPLEQHPVGAEGERAVREQVVVVRVGELLVAQVVVVVVAPLGPEPPHLPLQGDTGIERAVCEVGGVEAPQRQALRHAGRQGRIVAVLGPRRRGALHDHAVVALRRHVEGGVEVAVLVRFLQLGMDGRQVVRLAEVVLQDLPVARHVGRQRRDPLPVVGLVAGPVVPQRTQELSKGRRIGVHGDPHESGEGLTGAVRRGAGVRRGLAGSPRGPGRRRGAPSMS